MTYSQHLRSALPLYTCDVCLAVNRLNPECTACTQFGEELAYDKLQEYMLDDLRDREDMRYVDELGEEF